MSSEHESLVRQFIEAIGDDPERPGLEGTPARVVRSWGELFRGYAEDPSRHLATFDEGTAEDLVVLEGTEFFSFCEHHLLPFFGTISIGYIPGESGRVIGASKLARIADVYARRLQIQERLGREIANAIDEGLAPRAVGVVIRARHMCMCGRGVGKQGSALITSRLLGLFRDDARARAEFLHLIGAG